MTLAGLSRASAATAALVLLLAGTAAAQGDSTVYVGGSGQPGVQVDLGAIDGGYYGGRRLLMPNSKLSGPVVLRPPGASEKVTLKRPSGPSKRSTAAAQPAQPSMAATTPGPVTTPPVAPPPPKLAAEPPPPKTKKRIPVETEPLTPKSGEAAAAPEPPPPPPPPPGGADSAPAAGKTAEKTGKTKEAAGAAMAPPPPPPPAADMAAVPSDIPPPPPPPPADESGAAPVSAPPAQVAALPSDKAVPGGKSTPVSFTAGSATLGDAAKEALAAVAKTLSGDPDLRLQIVAYATGDEDNASQARRLSLSRALAVRSYLIDNGIRSTRMDVRALGNKFDAGPGDRVDLIVVNQ